MPRKKDPTKPKSKGGRPKIPLITRDLSDLENKLPKREINFDQVLYWIDLGSPAEEIAGAFHVSCDTLERRIKEHTGLGFAQLKERCSGGAKTNLRNNQYKLSETNATMGIWLGKQWLGQRDNEEKNEAPRQEQIDIKDKFYAAQYEIQLLKKELNDLKSKTGPELQPSDTPF